MPLFHTSLQAILGILSFGNRGEEWYSDKPRIEYRNCSSNNNSSPSLRYSPHWMFELEKPHSIFILLLARSLFFRLEQVWWLLSSPDLKVLGRHSLALLCFGKGLLRQVSQDFNILHYIIQNALVDPSNAVGGIKGRTWKHSDEELAWYDCQKMVRRQDPSTSAYWSKTSVSQLFDTSEDRIL